jgi:hypothetical protein
MRKVFIVFEIEKGVLTPHDHPVFTGAIAYDLQQEQQIFVHPDFNVREFTSEAEVHSAIIDYMREHVGEETDREPITPFVVLPVCTVAVPNVRVAKSRMVRGVQPEKKSSTKTK